jgi:serine O-acetyltransferase
VNKFAADIARYKAKGNHGKDLWLNPMVWALAVYRLRNWALVARPSWPILIPITAFCFVTNKFFEIFMATAISAGASIGEGIYMGHVGGVIISQHAMIGKNCDISQRVTIGVSAMGREGAPVIGDDVYVGTGATLVGKIIIGSGAKIAANTLVIDNVPDGATVMGVPGRVLIAPPVAVQPPQPVSAGRSDRS